MVDERCWARAFAVSGHGRCRGVGEQAVWAGRAWEDLWSRGGPETTVLVGGER